MNTMTPAERKAITADIIDTLVRLGVCEPRTEEERREVEAIREQLGAERFDLYAREAYIGVIAIIGEEFSKGGERE